MHASTEKVGERPTYKNSELGHDVGFAKLWGRKRTRQFTSRKIIGPSRKASGELSPWVLYRKNRAMTPERGGKSTRRRWAQTRFEGAWVEGATQFLSDLGVF